MGKCTAGGAPVGTPPDGGDRPAGAAVTGVNKIGAEVRSLWPDAPVRAADPVGRWLRAAPDGARAYLQAHAWDRECRLHYLVARVAGGATSDQRRFVRLEEAVDALHALCAGAPAAG